MKNGLMLATALSIDGLDNTCESELAMLSQELGLESLAVLVAEPLNRTTEQLTLIGKASSLLAVRKAVLRYQPDGKAYSLPNYLKHFTALWARRLAKIGAAGKPFPQVDLSKVLAEAAGQRIYRAVVKAGVPPDDSTELDQQQLSPESDDCQLCSQPLGVVKAVLEQHNFSWTEDTNTIHTTINCDGTVCSFSFKLVQGDLHVSVGLPVFAQSTFRHRMYEVLNAINWKLSIGNFEMDPEDGELRYRTTMPLHGTIPTEPQVDCMFGCGMYAVRKYGLSLIEAGLTDHDTDFLITRAEKNSHNQEEQ